MASTGDIPHFWTALFEENGLIPKLPEIARDSGGRSLSTKESGQVKVKASPATAMGDNFLSDTFIVEAKTDKDAQSLTGFIKVLPFNSMMRRAASSGGVYKREISAYQNLFPILRDLRGDRPIPLDVTDLYYARLDDEDNTCVLLEDLKAKGFRMTDKTQGVDFHHARFAVLSLAHYHSLTMTALKSWKQLSSSTGEMTTNYPDGIKFMKEKSMFDKDPIPAIKDWLGALIEFTEDVQRPDLTEWLKRDIQKNLAEVAKIETLESAGEMACILHGDYWNNNLMFHYDANGQPDALRMVDFQIVRVGHPLNDLLYFFYSSTRPELRDKHLELLRLYFLTLKADLELLDAPLDYSWNRFEEDYKKRSKAWFLMGGMVLSFVLNNSVVTDLQKMDKEVKNELVSEKSKETGESCMSVEMKEKMSNMAKNPSQKWSSNKILTDRMIKLVEEIKSLNSPALSTKKQKLEDGNDNSKFWKHIFEEERLALRMSEIAGNSAGLSFDSRIYKRVDVTASPASALGDNFSSIVYLVKAVVEDGTTYRSFVKVMPSISMLFHGALDMKVFRREAVIYQHFHSELRQIRSGAGLSENELPLNVPEMFYAHLDESGGCGANTSVIILEDLKHQGYRMVDKRVGCTKEEAKIALTTLARYHALSIAAVKKWKLPDGSLALPEPLSYIPARTTFDGQLQFMIGMYVPLHIQMLKGLGHEPAGQWLEQEYSALSEKALTPQALDECGPLGCITHSDCWNNNMLYRYSDDGKPTEMKLIDWQITRLGHPGSDIVHFLFSSAQPEILFEENGLQELLNHYYDDLSSSLENLGLGDVVRKCARQQFIEEVKGRFYFGMFMALMILPGVLDDSGLMQEMEEKDAKEKVEKEGVNVEEKMDELKGMINIDRLLSNKLLCQRIIKLVEGVKASLG